MTLLRTAALAAVVVALTAFAPRTAGTGTLVLINDSAFTVTHVYVSACDEDSWEGDLFEADEVLEAGYEIEVEVDAGCWDLQAVVDNDTELESYSVEIEEGDVVEWTITSE